MGWLHQSVSANWMQYLQKTAIPEWLFLLEGLSGDTSWTIVLKCWTETYLTFSCVKCTLVEQTKPAEISISLPSKAEWLKSEIIALGKNRQGNLSQLMAISSSLPPARAAPAVPSHTSMSPALGIALQKWQAGNTQAGVDALKAVATKLCQYGSGPRAVFSWAEVQRNLTALPATENSSMRRDMETLP